MYFFKLKFNCTSSTKNKTLYMCTKYFALYTWEQLKLYSKLIKIVRKRNTLYISNPCCAIIIKMHYLKTFHLLQETCKFMKVTFVFPQVTFLLAQVLAWKCEICCTIVRYFHETLATCGNMKTFMFHLPVWHSLYSFRDLSYKSFLTSILIILIINLFFET